MGARCFEPASEEGSEAPDRQIAEQVPRCLSEEFRPEVRSAEGRNHQLDFGFPKRHRLTRGAELQVVIREGKRVRTVNLDVRILTSPLSHPRVGIVVPTYRHTAVARNRLKRQLRELVRLHMLPEMRKRPAVVDVALRAKPSAYGAGSTALAADISAVCTAL